MNKSDLITSMAEKSKLTKKDAEAALKSFIDSVEETLEKGEKVQLVGFGTFETRKRAARVGRNPRTKEEINIHRLKLDNINKNMQEATQTITLFKNEKKNWQRTGLRQGWYCNPRQ